MITQDMGTIKHGIRQNGKGVVTTGAEWRELITASLGSALGAMAAIKKHDQVKYRQEAKAQKAYKDKLVKAAKQNKKGARKKKTAAKNKSKKQSKRGRKKTVTTSSPSIPPSSPPSITPFSHSPSLPSILPENPPSSPRQTQARRRSKS